jgi:hypothetical protein
LDDYFGATNGFAGEAADFAGFVAHNAVFGGMNGKVTAHFSTWSRALGHADLTHNNLADFHFLSAKKFNAKALAWTVVNVFGSTAGFNVTHV